MRSLNHPNINECLGITTINNRKTLILEMSDGGSLQDLMKDYGPFNETLIRKYVKQLVEALTYLRSKTVQHLRICCQNILSDLNGNIKLCQPRCKLGNLIEEEDYIYWQAPEIILHSQPNDRSDVWGLGCTIIEMLTGTRPWQE